MTAIEMLTSATLCVVLLAIGLAIGWTIARFAEPSIGVQKPAWEAFPRDTGTEVLRLVSQWLEMRLRLGELVLFAREIKSAPPEIPPQWRSEIVELANELHQCLVHKLCDADAIASSTEACPRGKPASEMGMASGEGQSSGVLTNAHILELLDGQTLGRKDHNESLPLVRYKYSVKQPLATGVSTGPLPVEAFSMVQCHDLSVRDVRYFVDKLPTDDNVVIGLGTPTPVKWFAAELEDYRRAYMYGRIGYLVTARLLTCIDKRGGVLAPTLLEHSARG